MMTPERPTGDEENPMDNVPLMGDGPLMNEDVDLESQDEDDDDEDASVPTETMEDEPTNQTMDDEQEEVSRDINNTLNTSVSSENCKIINESDPIHQGSPCPDPEGLTTVNSFNGMVMNGDDVVPDAANLTPVKLDPGLIKEQDTFTSSPTNSRGEHVGDDIDEIRPTRGSRRQQQMRIIKCYSAVAVIVLVFAIGIPLGAVMIFKSNSTETSFAGASEGNNNNHPLDPTTVNPDDMRPPQEPPIVEEDEENEEAIEDLDDEEGTTDPPVFVEDQMNDNELVDDEDGTTDPPLFVDEADTEAPFFVDETDDTSATPVEIPTDTVVVTDAPTTEVNITGTDPFEERNVTSVPEEEEEEEVTTDPPVEEEVTANPTKSPTASPTASPTVSPTTESPTTSPTSDPTKPQTQGPDRSGVYFDLINVTAPAVLQDTSTPQALSYLWLVEKDLILPVPSGRYLLQRYILVVMDHVLHDPVGPGLSDPKLDHCQWEGVVCDIETGDVKEINWRLKGLNGRLVEEMKHLDSLERIDFSENELVGTLEHLYGATQLKNVYLHNNKLSGMLTEQVGQMELLEALHLGHNELTGQIPISLRSPRGEAKPLKWLILSHNKFSGYLPPDWRMRNLFYLDLGHNMLSGPLPNDWDVNMVRLRHLYLDHNQFSGRLPAYFGQIGNGRLKQLHLNDNLLVGKVPENWNPLDQLTNIAVQNNNLTVPVSPVVCEMSVFEQGVLVELRTDCDICTCDFLCEMCNEK